jgi:hypothetical protein
MPRKLQRPLAAVLVLLCAAIAVTGPALALGWGRPAAETSPQTTVRDFLSSAVVDNNGSVACAYLTARGRESFERHLAGPDCTTFFGSARLTLGGLALNSDRRLGMVTYTATAQGGNRLVRVSHGGQSVSFVLRRANGPEAGEFQAPPTPWRIASGLTDAF